MSRVSKKKGARELAERTKKRHPIPIGNVYRLLYNYFSKIQWSLHP